MTPAAGASLPDDGPYRLSPYRRVAVFLLIGVAIILPAVGGLSDVSRPVGERWFLLAGSVVFAVVTLVFAIAPTAAQARPAPAVKLTVIVALAIALFVVGKMNWLGALAVASGACGRLGRTPRPALLSSAACGAAGLAVTVASHLDFGSTIAAILIPPMCASFAYGISKRMEMVDALRRTRADLARAAVTEERLRIARDMHDLLGHSLSLITLKAELAGRVVGTDPGRAVKEIAELESVARQSLSDVRAAVAGYRQPDLAGELVAARQLLDSAGIASRITAADGADLAQEVDAALAWAVREGTTNVVRHSRATHVAIRVSTGPAAAVAEISDNGPVSAADPGPLHQAVSFAGGVRAASSGGPNRVALGGSGLAGLAERVRALGGELAAETVEPQGFRLRVVVPLGRPA